LYFELITSNAATSNETTSKGATSDEKLLKPVSNGITSNGKYLQNKIV